MAPRDSNARQRVIAAAAQMLAQHGLNATSIRETIKRAEAPLGSTYHHFPGGKQQVVAEAVQLAERDISAALDHHLADGAAGLDGFLALWRKRLVAADFRRGCPVLAVAVEEPIDDSADAALAAADQAFGQWQRRLADWLRTRGHEAQDAASLATLVLAAIEGAIVLCRAQRSIAPFDTVAARLKRLIAVR